MPELVTLKFRRGTTAEWIATPSKLAAGEPGFDTTNGNLKIGNGSSLWADLPAFKPGTTRGSSITANGATVACDDPATSGSILLRTTANTGNAFGNIVLDARGRADAYVYINSSQDLAVTAGAGVSITTGTTRSFFDNTHQGGPGGQISFASSDSVNPALLTIGGPPATTGLYISNNRLLFNNVAVGGPSIANNVTSGTIAIASGGSASSALISVPGITANAVILITQIGSSFDTTATRFIASITPGTGFNILADAVPSATLSLAYMVASL